MKSTGIVRKVDELGRIVIPMELRKTMDIKEKDPLEIYVEGNCIILTKYHNACIFCNSADNVVDYNDKCICAECLAKIKEL